MRRTLSGRGPEELNCMDNKITFWTKWKSYSSQKKLIILTLLAFGFCMGFIIGYMKGSTDMANLVLNVVDIGIKKANVSIDLSDITKGYLMKAGIR